MLDEEEFAEIRAVYNSCVRAVQEYRVQRDASIQATPLAELYRPVQQAYARLTGVIGLDAQHILKHRIPAYGPPCLKCGRPLRTSKAKMCASCGESRAS